MTQSRTMYDVLKAPDRLMNEVSSPKGVLARIFRETLLERGVDLVKFDNLFTAYAQKARQKNGGMQDMNARRSLIFRTLSNPEMDWDGFLLGLKILRAEGLALDVAITFDDSEVVKKFASTHVE